MYVLKPSPLVPVTKRIFVDLDSFHCTPTPSSLRLGRSTSHPSALPSVYAHQSAALPIYNKVSPLLSSVDTSAHSAHIHTFFCRCPPPPTLPLLQLYISAVYNAGHTQSLGVGIVPKVAEEGSVTEYPSRCWEADGCTPGDFSSPVRHELVSSVLNLHN